MAAGAAAGAVSELDGRAVGDIVEGWSQELQASVAHFEAHADTLEAWDNSIHQNRCVRVQHVGNVGAYANWDIAAASLRAGNARQSTSLLHAWHAAD